MRTLSLPNEGKKGLVADDSSLRQASIDYVQCHGPGSSATRCGPEWVARFRGNTGLTGTVTVSRCSWGN